MTTLARRLRYGRKMEAAWEAFANLLRHPTGNGIAVAFAGILMTVLTWRFAPMIIETIPALDSDRAWARLARAVLTLGAVTLAGLLAAAMIGMLRAPAY